jgi:hypothetical protein
MNPRHPLVEARPLPDLEDAARREADAAREEVVLLRRELDQAYVRVTIAEKAVQTLGHTVEQLVDIAHKLARS